MKVLFGMALWKATGLFESLLRLAADLRGNRHDRLSAQPMLRALFEDQLHGAFTHLRRKLVHCIAREAPPYSVDEASGETGAAGWGSGGLGDDEILDRLFALNQTRATA